MNLQNLSSGVEFYMVDCYHQKIFVHSSKSKVLCGYSKKTLEEEGLGFYNLIFKSDDIQWLKKMYEKASDLFYTFPLSARKKIEIFYDLPVIKKNGEELLVHHKVVPFQFCEDGNAWLVGCFASLSVSKESRIAYLVSRKTGVWFEFCEDGFVSMRNFEIAQEDEKILKMMLQNKSDKEIAMELDIPQTTFSSRKQRLMDKLNVSSLAGLIHQAHLLGVI